MILSIALLAVVVATVFIGWFFDFDLHSRTLWTGGGIIFATFATIYVAPLYFKIASIFLSIFLIAAYISYLFAWPLTASLIIGLAVVVFILFTYLAI